MKLLDFFSIKQKLVFFLLFLSSAVSYLVISNIYTTEQTKHSNIEIEIVQQQKLILEKFINALFLSKQQADADYSELNKHQFIFNNNLKAMQVGGEAYQNLDMRNGIVIQPDFNDYIKIEIHKSQKIWDDLQTFSQSLQLQPFTIEQLSTVHYLAKDLHNTLTKITTALTQQKPQKTIN